MAEYDIYSLLVMMTVISFLGFLLENIWLLATKGFADNRNMSLPFLLGYGMLVVGLYVLIGTPQTFDADRLTIFKALGINGYAAYFILCFVLVSLCEIILGVFVERFFGFEYWNYTRIPLHFTKYTSVPTSTGFAIIITLFMGKCFPSIMELINKLPHEAVKFIGVTFTAMMTIDFIISFRKMYKTKSLNTIWRKELSDSKLRFKAG